jgi:hypothetical protein
VRSTVRATRTQPVNPDVESYCWHENGWECAAEGSVRDARKVTRGRAAAFFARETCGYLPDVRVWKRYVRPLTHQDAWDYSGRDRWCWRNEADDDGPASPPEGWEPDWECDPVWEFVHRSHSDAIPVWICAEKGSKPPQDPRPRTVA